MSFKNSRLREGSQTKSHRHVGWVWLGVRSPPIEKLRQEDPRIQIRLDYKGRAKILSLNGGGGEPQILYDFISVSKEQMHRTETLVGAVGEWVASN